MGKSKQTIISGYKKIDQVFSGFLPGHLYCVSSRPSEGKTTLLLNICEKILAQGKKIGYFSTVESKDTLYQRFFTIKYNCPTKILKWNHNGEKFEFKKELAEIISCISRFDIIRLNQNFDLFSIIESIRELNCDIVIIEDIHNLSSLRYNLKGSLSISKLTQGLSFLAKQTSKPIIISHFLNRSILNRRGKYNIVPRTQDIFRGKQIVQSANIIFLVQRHEFYNVEWIHPGLADLRVYIYQNMSNIPTEIKFSLIQESCKIL